MADELRPKTPPWFWNEKKLEPLEDGTIIAEKFMINRFLGQGGFGQVYEAHELALERAVAIKRLILIDSIAEEFWKKSIKGLLELGVHPRVLEFYSYERERHRDGDEYRNEYYLAMEYAPNGNLEREIERGYSSHEDAVKRFLEVLDAVEFLHSKRIVHRDIKAGNVLIAADGSLKLGDFDTLRVLDKVSRASSVVGTPRYMAPEVAIGRKYDHRADVYSLGLLLCEMLSNRRIGEDDDVDSMIEELSEPYRLIVEKATQTSDKDRYQSCAELKAALDDAIGVRKPSAQIAADHTRAVKEEAVEVEERKPEISKADRTRAVVERAVDVERPIAPEAEPRLWHPDLEMVTIPAGSFLMGAVPGDEDAYDDEKPRHEVKISRPFRMMVYPVTQGLYEKVMGKNPSFFKGDGRRPVESVSWFDAVKFCNKLSELAGLTPCYQIEGESVHWDASTNGYRLPTEAEWEYAARGGVDGEVRYGDLNDIAWWDENSGNKTHPVGEKEPNGYGLYDVLGNVWEWCWDWYDEDYYESSPRDNPRGPSSGEYRVLRGGSWWDGSPQVLRSSNRYRDAPDDGYDDVGFRCVVPVLGN